MKYLLVNNTPEDDDTVDIECHPLYEEEKSLGPISISVPRRYLAFNLRPKYAHGGEIIYLNAAKSEFYDFISDLPNPVLSIWILKVLKGRINEADQYGQRRLAEEALRRNMALRHVDPNQTTVQLPFPGHFNYQDTALAVPDVVLTRMGANTPYSCLALQRQLSELGVPVLNGAEAVECARDKIYSAQRLRMAGVPLPRTIAPSLPATLVDIEAVGRELKYPLIVKLAQGTQGAAVWKISSAQEFKELSAKMPADQPYLFQEYVHATQGRDLRLYVVGERVAAGMMRVAATGQFKANYHLGGSVQNLHVGTELEQMAVRAAAICGLDVAGVDVLMGSDSYYLCEVNASPGYEGLERAAGVNIAAVLIQACQKKKMRCDPSSEEGVAVRTAAAAAAAATERRLLQVCVPDEFLA